MEKGEEELKQLIQLMSQTQSKCIEPFAIQLLANFSYNSSSEFILNNHKQVNLIVLIKFMGVDDIMDNVIVLEVSLFYLLLRGSFYHGREELLYITRLTNLHQTHQTIRPLLVNVSD